MNVDEAQAHALRGKIIRALVAYGGTARKDEYVDALADAGEFNRRHPAIAIPKAYKILGFYSAACIMCHGEGVKALGTTMSIGTGIAIATTTCGMCEGSGYESLIGVGDAARVKVASPGTVPR